MLQRVAESLCLCWLVLCGTTASAQPVVAIEQEPAHRLVLQNDFVRVFEVGLPPGEDSLWHVHRHDGISVRLADAAIEDEPENGRTESFRLRRGELAYGATPAARTHRVRNVGATTFHNIYIELLTDHDVGRDRTAAAASARLVEFENDRVRALRRILAPGESTAMHTHASNGVAVLVTAGRLEISAPAGAARTSDVKAGAVQWIDAGTTHSLKNVGDAPIEIVDIEPR
ncbi:MAG: cupin domain-containing protein [Steroidobacteraceae bacterium]|nr:cupin domain-containing protein [Steroidobacteraceae bacterium]MBP9130159.1 cupin domain-containing protein [Steroidobacteraceae bacterium]